MDTETKKMPYTIKKLAGALLTVLFCIYNVHSVPIQPSPHKGGSTVTSGSDPVQPLAHKFAKRSSDTTEFFMNQESHSSMVNHNQNNTVQNQAIISQQAFNNELVCPKTVSTGMYDPDHKRSTCPWYYEIDHDATRFPTTLLNAVSLCTHCIGSNGMHECVPLKNTFKGLKQEKELDNNGNYIWKEIEITQTVGFTCAGRRTALNAATTTKTSEGQETASDDIPWA